MADTNENVDILVVIDAASIIQQYGAQASMDASKPTSIGRDSKFIYMFVKRDNVVSGDYSSNLTVSVRPNDVVSWRATSLSMNTEYSIMLAACDIAQGANLLESPPKHLAVQRYVEVPHVENGAIQGEPDKQVIKDFLFRATVTGTGRIVYTYTFAITNIDGAPRGFFTWDPSLTSS
ncbi:AidA/PixA family protein [Archangium primigenium]|uniref:AidA/PixA family protein n=1 Tax=[Archangium] primigenium TaxID=2792470 RepID=UPI00195B6F59|nr:AidA/PixA family protein [Archangium primigenium]MBM7119324.1 inclusion body family protein [Archangium primigenium]